MLHFTPTILKNLFSKSATRLYPIEKREPFENVRGELDIDIAGCKLCGICARKCPAACITVDKKKGIWQVDPFACIYCGICADNCPTKCLFFKGQYREPVIQKVVKIMEKPVEEQVAQSSK